METKKKDNVLVGFIKYFYGNFVVLLLGFVSLPLTTRVLDAAEYGKTSMFSSAVSVIYIFAILGLDQTYIRYYYKDGVNRKKLFYQCLIPSFTLISVAVVVYFIFAEYFNMLLFGESSVSIIIPVAGYAITSVFERFLFLDIRMEQNATLYSNLNILSKVLNVGFIVFFAWRIGNDFRVVIYSMSLSLFLVTVFIFVRFLIRTRTDNCSNHSVSQRELVLYGLPFVPMLLMEWLLQWMDKWSIRTFQDFAETGIYASASQIMTVLLTFKISYVAFWSPVAMEKYENCSEKECKDFFTDMFDKVQFLGMCAAFLLTIFRDVIVLILGKNYRDAVLIIPFLSLMPIMSTLFEMTGQGVKFVGKTKYFYYSSGAAIICNFVGNNVLVPRFAGAGAALATAITYIVYFAIGTYFSNKCYPVNYKFGKFSIAIVIYFLYSIYATFMDKGIICSLIGCVLLALICLINYSTLKGLLQIFKSMAAVYIGKIKGLVKK